MLVSSTGDLADISRYVDAPVAPGGSLNDLTHFLSKDPGRERFKRASDRRRYKKYIKVYQPYIEYYSQIYLELGLLWTPEFLAVVRSLFEQVKTDILNITGYPEDLTFLQINTNDLGSASTMIKKAIDDFSKSWNPSWKTSETYRMDKHSIVEFLSGSSRFSNRMNDIDRSWRNLIAGLYNLYRDRSWKIAVSYDPLLDAELNELLLVTLSSDIFRRNINFLEHIPDQVNQFSTPVELRWSPDMAFFKSLPQFNGQTSDSNLIVFNIKVNLGYNTQDPLTQQWMSGHVVWLTDYCRKYFSNLYYEDFFPIGKNSDLKFARLKAEMIHPINKMIVMVDNFGKRSVGLREVALFRTQFTEINK